MKSAAEEYATSPMKWFCFIRDDKQDLIDYMVLAEYHVYPGGVEMCVVPLIRQAFKRVGDSNPLLEAAETVRQHLGGEFERVFITTAPKDEQISLLQGITRWDESELEKLVKKLSRAGLSASEIRKQILGM